MSGLETLFYLVVFFGSFAWAWSFIAKKLKSSGKNKAVQHLSGAVFGFCAASIVSIIVGLATGVIKPEPAAEPIDKSAEAQVEATPPAPSKSVAPAAGEATESAPTPVAEKTLNMTAEQYINRLNTSFEERNMSYRVGKQTFSKGAVNNTITASLGKFTGLSLTISKANNELNTATMIAVGDGSALSGAEITALAVLVMAAADPTVDPNDLLADLPRMIKGLPVKSNAVSFGFHDFKELGMGKWFFAEPK